MVRKSFSLKLRHLVSKRKMSVELQPTPDARSMRSAPPTDDEEGNNLIQTLPPSDKGAEAWKFLFASFIVEAVLWGTVS